MRYKAKNSMELNMNSDLGKAVLKLNARAVYNVEQDGDAYAVTLGKNLKIYMDEKSLNENFKNADDAEPADKLSEEYLGFDLKPVMAKMEPVLEDMLHEKRDCYYKKLLEEFNKEELFALYILVYKQPFNDYKRNNAEKFAYSVFKYVGGLLRAEGLMRGLNKEG